MICLSTYDSLDAIPEAMRPEFENKDGKWQLKPDAIPGVGELFNKALADNATKAVDQVKARNITINGLQEKITLLENQVALTATPGAVSLSEADAKLWKRYTELGTPKELEDKLGEFETVKQKAERAEVKDTMEAVAQATGLNVEVLTDWISSQPAGSVRIEVKDGKVKDPKTGAEVDGKVAQALVLEDRNGSKVESKHSLLEYAKEKMPSYMFEALTKAPAEAPAEGGKGAAVAPPAQNTGIRLPNLGSAQTTQQPAGGSGDKPVDRFNAARDDRPSPFAQPKPAAAK